MDILGSYSEKLRDYLPSIQSLEPSSVEKDLVSWSSSLVNQLAYSNIRGGLIAIGRFLEPKNLKSRYISSVSFVSSYIEDNPVIFSITIGGNEIKRFVNLPYLGAVSLDTLLFFSSVIFTRAYQFWRNRRSPQIAKDDGCNPQFRPGPRPPPVKATVVKGYKDESLHKTIQECQDVKKSLRRVVDPEVARKQKRRQLALQKVTYNIEGKDSNSGYLGMSPASLQDARFLLRYFRDVSKYRHLHVSPTQQMVQQGQLSSKSSQSAWNCG